MLSCKDVAERATAYIERDLSWAERLQYRLHLAMCSVCRRYVDQMRTTMALVRRLGESALPPEPVDPALIESFRSLRDRRRPS